MTRNCLIVRQSWNKVIAIIVAACAVALASTVSSSADDLTPPKIDTTTPTGVSLSDGSFIYTNTDISVGPLKLERFHMGGPKDPSSGFFGTHMSHNFDIYVVRNPKYGTLGQRYKPIVHIGASASGTYTQAMNSTSTMAATPESMDGTLEVVGEAYVYTSQDGTVYTFDPSVPATPPYSQRVKTIVYPNGRTLSFSYVNGQLKLVFDNSGYAIVFDYNGDGGVSAACGFNLASVYVSTSTTCTSASLKTTYGYTRASGSYSYSELTSITDVLGNTTTLGYRSYSMNGEISCVQPPGYSTCRIANTYTDSGFNPWQVTQQTLSSGAVWRFSTPADAAIRNPQDLLSYTDDPTGTASVVDPLGNASSYEFSRTSPYAFTDALGRRTAYVYTGGFDGYEASATDNPNNVHAEGKLLVSVTLPEGNGYQPLYNGPYNAISQETYLSKPDGSGHQQSVAITYGYGNCPTRQNCTKPIWKRDPLGNQTDYAYDDAGNLLTEMAPAPNRGSSEWRPLKVYTYSLMYAYIKNSSGTLVSVSTPIWMVTSETQCRTAVGSASNAPACDTSQPRTVKTYQYGAPGTANNLLPVSVTTQSADGSLNATTAYTYTDQGDVASADGPLTGEADKTYTTYDLLRRKIAEIGAAYTSQQDNGTVKRRATQTTYRVSGEVLKVEEGTVDGLSSPSMSTFYDLNWTLNDFDGYGRIVRTSKQHYEGTTVVTTAVTETKYDGLDRVVCTAVRMNWDPTTKTFGSFGADACTLSSTPTIYGPDRITKNTYDAAGQLLKITKAYGTPQQQDYAAYTYSLNGKQTSVTDANGNLTRYTFDGFDRLGQTTFPSPTAPGVENPADYEAYAYDVAGNRTSLRKRDNSYLYYSFDALNRERTRSTASVPAPSDCSTVLSSVLACNDYDYAGHVWRIRTNGITLASVYDALGRKTSESNTYGSFDKTMTYQYDIAGRRTQVTWPESYVVTYDYDAAGHMLDAKDGGTTLLASWALDTFGRTAWVSFGGGSTHSVAASWSPDDDLNTLANTFASSSYNVNYTNSFTPAKQIASALISNSAFAYQGTVATTPYAINGLNQYTNVGGQANTGSNCGGTQQAITYDCNGSMTSDGTYNFGYDPENRLTSASLIVGGMSATYSYDSLGRRYQKNIPTGQYAGTTYYLDSGDDEIAEYTGANGTTLKRRYIPGPSVDRPIAMIDNLDTTPVTRFFYTDRQGSVTAMSDAAGNLTEGPYTYDAYGLCMSGANPCPSTGVAFRYTGRRYDPETGIYYYRARYYSPKLGRFLQTDPIGYKDDLNWYAYVGNDPTDKTDPSGNCAEDACAVEGGIAISAGAVYVATGALVAVGVCVAACGYIHDQIGNAAQSVWNGIVHNNDAKPPPKSLPIKGKPGSVVALPGKDGKPKQTREYGDDSYPARDIDRGHDHGQGDPHVHDWTRPSDGSPPTAQDRQTGRPPKQGEVENHDKRCVPKPPTSGGSGGTSC